jgi:hypothetical protein
MRKGLVSDGHGGKNPNNVPSGAKMNASGSIDSTGRNVGRRHEHHRGGLVSDSPTYVAPATCNATNKEGKPCPNVLTTHGALTSGFCFGHAAREAASE